jgi:AbiU2
MSAESNDMEANINARELLNHIGNELKLLWSQMDAYQELFIINQEQRAPLLQKTAPGFFAITQVSFSESILMRVFRLMDPTKSSGFENLSILNLCRALNANDTAQLAAKTCIESIQSDWESKDGAYARLKAIRNKQLGHNDWAEHSLRDLDQLWMNLSNDEFKSALNLTGRLWVIYQQCSRVLRKTHVVEPIYATLDDRPSMLLKHLCASRYLDTMVQDEPEKHASRLEAIEAQEMGTDKVRPVFGARGNS